MRPLCQVTAARRVPQVLERGGSPRKEAAPAALHLPACRRDEFVIAAMTAASPCPVGLLPPRVFVDNGKLAQCPGRGHRHSLNDFTVSATGTLDGGGAIASSDLAYRHLPGVVVGHAVAYPVLERVVSVVNCRLARSVGSGFDDVHGALHVTQRLPSPLPQVGIERG